jgi:hypothetical protein
LYAALFGFFTQPIPFLPYSGLYVRLTVRLTLPVVRALKDFLIDGRRIPIFITNHFTLEEKICAILRRHVACQRLSIRLFIPVAHRHYFGIYPYQISYDAACRVAGLYRCFWVAVWNDNGSHRSGAACRLLPSLSIHAWRFSFFYRRPERESIKPKPYLRRTTLIARNAAARAPSA